MARIRSVKPELRTDLTVAEWPREVRYAWVLLLGYLDDHGRGRDDCRLVVADLFPLDRDVTERKVDGWLERMAKSGPLCRYSVDGERFLHAVKWASHQKISHPTDSRLPPCPVHDLHEPLPNQPGENPEPFGSDSGNAPEPLRASRARAEQGAGSREQGSREQGAVATAGSTAPAEAVRAYVQACPQPPAAALQARIERQARTLLAEGHEPGPILAAAASAGRAGWTDLAVQMQRDAARASPQHGTSTTDTRVSSALNLADHLDQKAIQ